MFGETTISYVKVWNHPTETTILKWMFRVPGMPFYKKNLMDVPTGRKSNGATASSSWRWCQGCSNRLSDPAYKYIRNRGHGKTYLLRISGRFCVMGSMVNGDATGSTTMPPKLNIDTKHDGPCKRASQTSTMISPVDESNGNLLRFAP